MKKLITLQPFSGALISERLQFENPWWLSGEVETDYTGLKPRFYLKHLYPIIEETETKRAVVVMGPRRVGKTVLMHHVIAQLLAKGVPKNKICFINIENPIYNTMSLEQLFTAARNAINSTESSGWYVFFDEIQYLKDWEIHLKIMVDSYPNTKFIVSGSASAALKMKSQESGAGRFTDFLVPPLTFHEFLELKNLGHYLTPASHVWKGNVMNFYETMNIRELNRLFLEYINFGGYPEVMFSQIIQSNPGRYIRSDIVDKVLLRDLPSLYGIQNVQELNSLFTTLAYHSGYEVSLDSLSTSSGVEKHLLSKYLKYLEVAFLIRVVNRVNDSAKRFQRATFFKVYLTNPSLRCALFAPLEPTDDIMGSMVETAIFSQWLHSETDKPWYARWSQGKSHYEVDMVGLSRKTLKPQWVLEIKWSNRYIEHTRELKSLLNFCKLNNLKEAMVTTIDKHATVEFEGVTIHFVPAAVYAYSLGKSMIDFPN